MRMIKDNMNGKQAKMLSKVKANRREIRDWKTLNAASKWILRRAFQVLPKLARPNYAVLGRDPVPPFNPLNQTRRIS